MKRAANGALGNHPHRSDTHEVGDQPNYGHGEPKTRRMKRSPTAATRSATFVSLSKKIAYRPSRTPQTCAAESQACGGPQALALVHVDDL